MTVDVKYFGMIAEKISRSEESLNIPISNGFNLRTFFESKYPVLKQSEYKIAVNHQFTDVVNESTEIFEIALLPPFAGG
jgi:molybdopterin converting factor small subunit